MTEAEGGMICFEDEEGAISQGVWMASSYWERHGNDSSSSPQKGYMSASTAVLAL